MTTPRLLAVGSCRVHRPLRAAHDAGLIDLVNYSEKWWFTHSPAAARQYVEVLAGNRGITAELRPVVCETVIELPSDLSAPEMLEVDAVVVEISSLRQLSVEDTQLNQQCVATHVAELGLPPKPVTWGDASALPDHDPIKHIRAAQVNRQGIAEELRSIQAITGAPVLTVDHLYAHTQAGEVVQGRIAIADVLQEVEQTDGFHVWSTRSYIDREGQAALEDQNHWAADAELPVGRLIVEAAGLAGQ